MTNIVFVRDRVSYDIPDIFKPKSVIRDEKIESIC